MRAVSYQLHIRVPRRCRLRVGRFGILTFPPGRYIYTGSARRNLAGRIGRHLSEGKVPRWHIDYLLAAPGVEVDSVGVFCEPECLLNSRTPGTVVAPGFGSSDCRSRCGSHLKRMGGEG